MPASKTREDLRKTAKLMQKVGWRHNLEGSDKNRCHGCQDGEACEHGVKECCIERELSNCGECESYPCVKIEAAFEITQKKERGEVS